jgi:hypothetical protein
MSGSGKAPVPNNQLVIYEPANWDVIYNGQNIERRSTTVENAPQWLIRLCQRLEKAEQDVRSLALAAANTDAMEIDVTELRTDYEAMSQAAAALRGIIPKNGYQDGGNGTTFQRDCARLPALQQRYLEHNLWPTK